MTTLKIKNTEGSQAGSLKLNESLFGAAPNVNCVRTAVRQYLNAQRAGTHSTKTRGFVRGGGRKPWRQKGTGRARQGSIRAPQWRGGAILFGPSPRSYDFAINKKVKRQALASVLSDMAKHERLIAIEGWNLEEVKTRRVAEILKNVGAEGRTLILTHQDDANLVLSARNIPTVECIPADSVNVYELLKHDTVVGSKSAFERLQEVFG